MGPPVIKVTEADREKTSVGMSEYIFEKVENMDQYMNTFAFDASVR